MIKIIETIILALILAGVCGTSAWFFKTRKQAVLQIITDLINKAEEKIQGSGLGSEKKAIVIAQLEAMGIKVTAWVSEAIDDVVDMLNDRSAWLVKSAVINIETCVQSDVK